MAKTRQTAKKTTGGHAKRRDLSVSHSEPESKVTEVNRKALEVTPRNQTRLEPGGTDAKRRRVCEEEPDNKVSMIHYARM